MVSEVKSLIEKGRDFPPSSAEQIKSARKSRLTRKYTRERAKAPVPESREEDISLSEYLGGKRPIRFKDAVGRKFTFPFDVVATWAVRYTCLM